MSAIIMMPSLYFTAKTLDPVTMGELRRSEQSTAGQGSATEQGGQTRSDSSEAKTGGRSVAAVKAMVRADVVCFLGPSSKAAASLNCCMSRR